MHLNWYDPSRTLHRVIEGSKLSNRIPLQSSAQSGSNEMQDDSSRALGGESLLLYSEDRKDSDLRVFGPKFKQIFDAYQNVIGKDIDSKDHLFVLCCNNLIPFAKWCRDDGKCFIRAVLPDHNDLRCEVRNGLATVLVYTFSALKAASNKTKSDMFKELSNPLTGFNIAHKCSIKIYTDPCFFLTFLKLSLSGLIAAGILPDNERINQPNSRRQIDTAEDLDELRMYNELIAVLANTIATDLETGKQYVESVVRLWTAKAKVRNFRRFLEAYNTLTGSNTSSSSSSSSHGDVLNAERGIGSMSRDSDDYVDTHAMHKRRRPEADAEVASPVIPVPALIFNKFGCFKWNVQPFLVFDAESLFSPSGLSSLSSVYLVNDQVLIANGHATSDLGFTYTSMIQKANHHVLKLCSLEKELQQMGAIVSMWRRHEFAQLLAFLSEWRLRCASLQVPPNNDSGRSSPKYGLIKHWNSLCASYFSNDTFQYNVSVQSGAMQDASLMGNNATNYARYAALGNNLGTRSRAMLAGAGIGLGHGLGLGADSAGVKAEGVLVFEFFVRIGIVLRECPALGVLGDVWGLFYIDDIEALLEPTASCPIVSFRDFLIGLFPQLESRLNSKEANRLLKDLSLKLCSHGCVGGDSLTNEAADVDAMPTEALPKAMDSSKYRNIGKMNEPATAVLNRITRLNGFHDFMIAL